MGFYYVMKKKNVVCLAGSGMEQSPSCLPM
jgi:hypothetical protein